MEGLRMPLSETTPVSNSLRLDTPLTRWQRLGLVLFFASLVIFGLVVEKRSAFMQRRMTDVDVYLRAAWAVRSGENIYTITEENGWHYHYPPLFAILLTPLADPPPGADRTGMLPFSVSAGIFYALNVLCLLLATHWLANAIESQWWRSSGEEKLIRGYRWWSLRLLPILVCLPPIGHTLMRGQVNVLLLFLLSGMIAASLRGRSYRSGLWLAGAICLKIIPLFLLIYPVWRRDWRMLGSCLVGIVVGMGVIPVLVFGPEKAFNYFREWDAQVRRPGLTHQGDRSRAVELTDIPATDSQSYVAVLHNTLNWDRATRPRHATWGVRLSHWLMSGGLTALTLLAAGRRRQGGIGEVMFIACLILMMLLASPICHLHYFALALPLVMASIALSWTKLGAPRLPVVWWILLGTFLLTNTVPQLPAFYLTRDFGLAAYGVLVLWAVGLMRLKSGLGRLQSRPMVPCDTPAAAA
jgi:alpha-1,2-mannosyltransferase